MNELHHFDLEQQKLRKYSTSTDRHITMKLLTKYFPKYQKKLTMTKKDGAIRFKIKRVKIIRSFQAPALLTNRSEWRVLLANKRRSVKMLTNHAESARIFVEKIKFLLGLQSVEILLSFLRRSSFALQSNQLEFLLSKACKYVGRLRNPEHLEASPITIGAKKCITRLNSHQRLLDSLKTLKFFFDWTNTSDDEISELIENSKNLLRNVTCLKLGTLYSNFHFESFQKVGELCSKLTKLEFEFSCREVINQVAAPRKFCDERFEVKTNFLQILKTFHHLRILNLSILDVVTLLKDFALPPSIQCLRLVFHECLSKEIMLRIDDSFAEERLLKAFEENNLFLRFYDSFKGLNQFETLEFLFAVNSHNEAYKYQNYFFQSLLKRISSPLKDLAIFPSIPFPKLNQAHEVPDSSLSQFIESCKGFASELKTLKFGSLKVIYSSFDLSSSWRKFTNLASLEVKANFCQSQGSNVENFGSFLQNLISLGDSITFIILEASVNRDAESLLSVLKQINKLQRLNRLQIRLHLYLQQSLLEREESASFETGTNRLQSLEKLYPKVKGASLKYSGYSSIDAAFNSFIMLYQSRFDKF